MARPLLSFVAILKDEAKSIRATLESVRPYVDHWTVLDTGSTDGTQDIVHQVMEGVPGCLVEEPFVDFATTRNRALELDRLYSSAVFTLMLSADETLAGGEHLRAALETSATSETTGAYCVLMKTSQRQWPSTRVLRSDAGWRYFGAIHEKPVSPAGEVGGPLISGVVVTHIESDPERKMKRIREHDLPLLTSLVSDETKTLGERASSMLFLAETHAILADGYKDEPGSQRLTHLMLAMSYYWRYADLSEREDSGVHDLPQAMYAYTMFYHLADKARLYTSEELASRLESIVEAFPKLPEAVYLLAGFVSEFDSNRGYAYALQAARAAAEAKITPPSRAPTDQRIEWMAYLLAMKCALANGNTQKAMELQDKARAAGAPIKEK